MSHQDRREPLPAEYQFPTHGVDCDCPPCRNQFIRVACDLWSEVVEVKNIDRTYQDHFEKPAYGWGV